jgi:uncharacterized membrane protein
MATTRQHRAAPRPRLARTRWGVVAVLCLATLLFVSPYLRFDPAYYFEEQRAVYLRHQALLGMHVIGAMVALAVGPFQLVRRFRRGRARVHRVLGVTYVAAATVGGLGGLGLAPTAYTGVVASLGFATMAVCFLGCTWTGVAMIVRGRVAEHRRWMVRSFAIVFGGVTLRLVLGTYSAVEASVSGWLPFHTVYTATSWLCWVPNLLLAVWITRRRPSLPGTPEPAREDVRPAVVQH